MSLHPHLDELSLWTIYDHPSDLPNSFVARRFNARDGKPTADFVVADTLDEVRALVQGCCDYVLHCIPRSPGDDAVIVESWL
jgi:hypothetical protein